MLSQRGSLLGRRERKLQKDEVVHTPFTISTPFRLLRTPLTEISETPYAIKYPLLAFLTERLGTNDMEIKMKARRVVSHAAQQGMIAKLESLQGMCTAASKQNNVLISELRRQYIMALLDNLPDADAFLQSLQQFAIPGSCDNEPRAVIMDRTDSTDATQQLVCRSAEHTPNIASEKATPLVRDHVTGTTTIGATPEKETPNNPTPIGLTPLNLMKKYHRDRLRIKTLSQKISNEPEHVQNAVRKRLSCIVEEPEPEPILTGAMTNVVYSTKRSAEQISTPAKKLRLTPRSDRRPSEGSLAAPIDNAPSSNLPYSVQIMIGDTPDADSAERCGSMSRRPYTPNASSSQSHLIERKENYPPRHRRSVSFDTSNQPAHEYKGLTSLLTAASKERTIGSIPEENELILSPNSDIEEPVQAPSTDVELSSKTQPKTVGDSRAAAMEQLKVSRRSSVASMFTSRGAPVKGNKFQSRPSLTAKLRRTRERKQLRERTAAINADNPEVLLQASSRIRKVERYEALAERKYAAFSDPNDIQCLKQVYNGEARAKLAADFSRVDTSPDWESLLHSLYKIEAFRPYQRNCLEYLRVYDDGPLLLSLPTGAGKSLVFMMAAALFALAKQGMSVMILPTKALVEDQYCAAHGVLGSSFNVVKLHSGLDVADYAKVYKGLAAGLIDYLLTTPEQFTTVSLIHAMSNGPRRLALCCIDEAHCLSEWSHTFRPAYQSVLSAANYYFHGCRVLMMTATITKQTEDSIYRATTALAGEAPQPMHTIKLTGGYWRDDLRVQVYQSNDYNVNGLERAIIQERQRWQSSTHLVFVWMKYQAEQLVRELKERGVSEDIYFYHSDVSDSEKDRLLNLLSAGRVEVLVSTQALGMGLDVGHITNVYHMTVPASIEEWLQEIGRCNRDKRAPLATCYGFSVFAEYWRRRQKTAASVIDVFAVAQFFRTVMSEEHQGVFEIATAKEMRFRLNNKATASALTRWKGDHHSVAVISVESAKRRMNCWTDDEINVMTAIVQGKCFEDRIGGEEVLGWWILSDYEFRCFGEDLDSLSEGGVLTELRRTIWQDRPNQGVYKLRWSELLMHDIVRDPLKLRDELYTICNENKISIRAVSGSRRLYIVKRVQDLKDVGDKLVRKIVGDMGRNNEEQLRKQEAVRLAWMIAEHHGQDALRVFLDQYFENTLSWPVKDPSYLEWLYEGVQQLDDQRSRSTLKSNVTLLRECLLASDAVATPLACARILCGVQRVEGAAQPWAGRYNLTPFETVLKLAS